MEAASKTMAALLDFVESCTDQGIYNKNTGSSRATAIKKFISALNIENQDVNDVNVGELVTRYANKFPGKLKPASLSVYQMRLAKSIEDFQQYTMSPANFKPQRNRSKVSKTSSVASAHNVSSNMITSNRDSALLEEANVNFSINPTMRLRLRSNVEVAISGLPVDLTPAESRRIKALIDVFTIANDKDE